MKDIGEGTIRQIDWQELTPVVLLLRVFNTATGVRVLFLALFALLLTLALGTLFSKLDQLDAGRSKSNVKIQRHVVTIRSESSANPTANDGPANAVSLEEHLLGRDGNWATTARMPLRINFLDPIIDLRIYKNVSFRQAPVEYLWRIADRSVLLPWNFFSRSGGYFFALDARSWTQRGMVCLWFVSMLLVWSFFGGMICRTVALRLTADESESLGELWTFMKTRGTGFASSIVIVTLGILCCLMPIWFIGLMFKVPVLDYLVALFFPVVLLFGLFAMILLIGLWFGWPLLFSAVATEGTDGFDSVSRMFSYLYQRPLHYLLYWIVAGLLGFLGYVLLSIFFKGTVFLATQIGGFPERLDDAVGSIPLNLIQTWSNLSLLILLAYAFSWFLTSGTAIYLLLRRSVDATPFDEVHRQGAAAENPLNAPEIKLDEKGAPVIEK